MASSRVSPWAIFGAIVCSVMALACFCLALLLGAFVAGKIGAMQTFGSTQTNSATSLWISVVLTLIPTAIGVGLVMLAVRISRPRPPSATPPAPAAAPAPPPGSS